MKNIELSACEEMIMTIIWNNEAELDLAKSHDSDKRALSYCLETTDSIYFSCKS